MATPLPPAKPWNTGHRWPAKTATATAARPASDTPNARAASTATSPLSASPASVSTAAVRLPVRSTLVAPGLPDP